MQDVTVARLQSILRVKTPHSPSFKCNVLRVSLSVGSQNIPCATLKRKGVVGNLYISGRHTERGGGYGSGKEPNLTTARNPGHLYYIKYSLSPDTQLQEEPLGIQHPAAQNKKT